MMRIGLLSILVVALAGCDRAPASRAATGDAPSPPFRNVQAATAYVGDSACASCHAKETAAYAQHAMARSFHRWTPATRVERALDAPLVNRPTGLQYSVVDSGGRLYQVESVVLPGGTRLHELRRPIDYVIGSGNVARSYFTEENGRLYQLPLTWYREHGWDFSPGYELHNARFDRLLPDRCVACHSSYPRPIAHLEGKYAETRPGIGCERCHGPGALHAQERRANVARAGAYDNSIVNPARLPLERRLDVCEQCHVHTPVNVLRERRTAFDYLPSQPLRDQWAFFKTAGSIDVVSHADRLKQSACFLASRSSARPLECATCHDPHAPPPTRASRSAPCLGCHQPAAVARRVASAARADHAPGADCVSCHMPRIEERTVPHGTFTEHWIRVVTPGAERPTVARHGDESIEPYYARDRAGLDGAVYRGMGGIVYATLAGDGRALGTAAEALQRALGADTSRDTSRAGAQFLLGVAWQQLGRPTDAARALERSVRADSTNPEALRALAKAYESAGAPPPAIEALYRRALALQPALAWIRAEYADFLQAHARVDEAEREYRRAVAEQPALATAWFALGTVLAGGGKPDDATGAFREAVRREPALAQALSSLLAVRAAGGTVTGVRALGVPAVSPLVRPRAPGAVRLEPVEPAAGAPGVALLGVSPRAVVQILTPDGTPLRRLTAGDDGALTWDLRTDAGTPIAGGLYRLRVQGRDVTGRPMPPQQLPIGVVRMR